MNRRNYEEISNKFLETKARIRELNKKGELNKKQLSHSNKLFKIMASWLLINTPDHQHPKVLEWRKEMAKKVMDEISPKHSQPKK